MPEHAWWISMYRWRYVRQMGNGDTFSEIGYARACMVDIHVQVEI
jgi:hypothetical protein